MSRDRADHDRWWMCLGELGGHKGIWASFTSQLGITIGWAFEDNGPNGGTLKKDRWKVNEPGSCPLYGDPNMYFYELISGDVTVRP